VKFIKAAEKNFFASNIHREYQWSIRWKMTQKDRKRHRDSDNFRLE